MTEITTLMNLLPFANAAASRSENLERSLTPQGSNFVPMMYVRSRATEKLVHGAADIDALYLPRRFLRQSRTRTDFFVMSCVSHCVRIAASASKFSSV